MRQKKLGIILMLIGIGIPSVLAFFQEDNELFYISSRKTDTLMEAGMELGKSLIELDDARKAVEELFITRDDLEEYLLKSRISQLQESIVRVKLATYAWVKLMKSTNEINFHLPYKYSIGLGLIIFITGIGLEIFAIMNRKGRTS